MTAVPTNWLWLIPFLPLLGAVTNGLVGPRLPKGIVGLVACSSIFFSFVVSVSYVLLKLNGLGEGEVLLNTVYPWLHIGAFKADIAFQMDKLSAVMCLVVTGVGFLIHVYSIGYMHDDPGYARYFTYLNLFAGAMLILVLGANLPLMFVGWEGVGLCSYLLIGFWFEDDEKASAGKKAFIVNRIGDFGFLLAMFSVFYFTGKVDFLGMLKVVEEGGKEVLTTGWFDLGMFGTPMVVTVICLLFFLGATGKSAQLPLYVWLPDAMAGPTPVSALIHAATMVTAGVYMVARLNFLFSMSPTASLVVAAVGAVTALYSATIAITQNDIKKVLAYSTVSQLGYMFLGVGVMAYSAGIFHLMTHAFFKALLFLCSGAVIHGLHGEQDIRKMGGLIKKMPITGWTWVIGWLAICGIFPFSGFFSKDEILWLTYSHGHKVLWAIGFLGALLTAFYMTRVTILTFFGESRVDEHVHPHDAPMSMAVPLIILAVLSLVGGLVGWPHHSLFEHYLEPVFEPSKAVVEALGHGEWSTELALMLASIGVAVVGIIAGFIAYLKKPELPKRTAEALPPLYKLSLNKYYVDEIYDAAVVQPIVKTSDKLLWRFVDTWVIDGVPNGLAWLFKGGFAEGLRRLQSGVVNSYMVWFLLGALLILGYMIIP